MRAAPAGGAARRLAGPRQAEAACPRRVGSFYPWDVLAAFHDGLCAAGALPRLPARRAVRGRRCVTVSVPSEQHSRGGGGTPRDSACSCAHCVGIPRMHAVLALRETVSTLP